MKKILIFVFALSLFGLSCGKPNVGDISSLNATYVKPNNDLPTISTHVRIFTANNLTEFFEQNKVEMEKMLSNQRIMVSGVVTHLTDDYIQLEGVNQGKVRCSGAIFYQDEWKKLKGLMTNFNKARSKRPLATVSGIYKSSVLPNVFLEECKVETATK